MRAHPSSRRSPCRTTGSPFPGHCVGWRTRALGPPAVAPSRQSRTGRRALGSRGLPQADCGRHVASFTGLGIPARQHDARTGALQVAVEGLEQLETGDCPVELCRPPGRIVTSKLPLALSVMAHILRSARGPLVDSAGSSACRAPMPVACRYAQCSRGSRGGHAARDHERSVTRRARQLAEQTSCATSDHINLAVWQPNLLRAPARRRVTVRTYVPMRDPLSGRRRLARLTDCGRSAPLSLSRSVWHAVGYDVSLTSGSPRDGCQ